MRSIRCSTSYRKALSHVACSRVRLGYATVKNTVLPWRLRCSGRCSWVLASGTATLVDVYGEWTALIPNSESLADSLLGLKGANQGRTRDGTNESDPVGDGCVKAGYPVLEPTFYRDPWTRCLDIRTTHSLSLSISNSDQANLHLGLSFYQLTKSPTC